MKTLQYTLKLIIITMVLVCTSCSKDDSLSEDSTVIEEPTNQELLMSGKWYIQSSSGGGANSECQQQSFMQFIDEVTVLNKTFYTDINNNCLHSGLSSSNYEFIGESSIDFEDIPGPLFNIDFISETQLILRQSQGDTHFIINLTK